MRPFRYGDTEFFERGVPFIAPPPEFDPSSFKVKKVGGVNYLICRVNVRVDDSNPGRKVELWPAVWVDKDDEPVEGMVSFEEMILEKTIAEVRQEQPPAPPSTDDKGTPPTPPKSPQPLIISKGVKVVFEVSEEAVMHDISGV